MLSDSWFKKWFPDPQPKYEWLEMCGNLPQRYQDIPMERFV